MKVLCRRYHRQPLEHQDGALLVGDVVGQLDQLVGRDHPFAGVAAEREIGDAVAGVKIGDARADGHDLAGGFVAGDERQPRRLVEAGAEIDVDEIHADGMLADADSPGPGAGTSTSHTPGLPDPHLVHAHGPWS